MSDVMLHGVLLMPSELWTDDPIDVAQRRSRYVQASVRIRELEALLEACFDDAQDALASHRKDVIEECAQLVDRRCDLLILAYNTAKSSHAEGRMDEADSCAQAIRALKSMEMAGSQGS